MLPLLLRKAIACCIVTLLCVGSNASAEAYRCANNGRTEYSDRPCAQSSKNLSRPASVTPERQLSAAEIQAQFEREVAEDRKRKEALATEAVITKEDICKAGIAKIMARDPKGMKIIKSEGGVVHLQYVRTNDNSVWSYRCRLEGTRIMWASNTGRWRDDPRDEKITYVVTTDTVTVKETFASGESTQQVFKTSQLK